MVSNEEREAVLSSRLKGLVHPALCADEPVEKSLLRDEKMNKRVYNKNEVIICMNIVIKIKLKI